MRVLDRDIRVKLYNQVIERFDDDTRIVDELSICQGDSRVDVAAINGKLHGYEIKSEADSLKRLPDQVHYYGKVFDTMTIVCSKDHLGEIREIVPNWWGIMTVRKGRGDFELIQRRKPRINKTVDRYSLAQLLWRSEAQELLDELGLLRGFKSKPKYELWNKIADEVETDYLRNFVRETLKHRQGWRA